MNKDNDQHNPQRKAHNTAVKIAKALDMPLDVLPTVPKISLTGNLSLSVDGHRGIMDYSDNYVKIALYSQILQLYGRGLEITNISPDFLLLQGHIQKVEFIQK